MKKVHWYDDGYSMAHWLQCFWLASFRGLSKHVPIVFVPFQLERPDEHMPTTHNITVPLGIEKIERKDMTSSTDTRIR